MAWTDERVEKLKQWWSDGLSASQIAGRLGSVTRNSVIGKIYRLELPSRVLTGRQKSSRPRRTHSERQVANRTVRSPRHPWNPVRQLLAEPFTPQPEPFVEPKDRQPILVRKDGCLHANDELTEQSCRWPCGDPGTPEFGFCGREKVKGIPYCLDHARIAFRMPGKPTPPAAEQTAPAREKVAA